jgi:hypothetical protein
MTKIFKYKLKLASINELQVPLGATVLHIRTQLCEIVIYFLVNPGHQLEKRIFEIYSTGDTMREIFKGRTYIGTIEITPNLEIYHIFEI